MPTPEPRRPNRRPARVAGLSPSRRIAGRRTTANTVLKADSATVKEMPDVRWMRRMRMRKSRFSTESDLSLSRQQLLQRRLGPQLAPEVLAELWSPVRLGLRLSLLLPTCNLVLGMWSGSWRLFLAPMSVWQSSRKCAMPWPGVCCTSSCRIAGREGVARRSAPRDSAGGRRSGPTPPSGHPTNGKQPQKTETSRHRSRRQDGPPKPAVVGRGAPGSRAQSP